MVHDGLWLATNDNHCKPTRKPNWFTVQFSDCVQGGYLFLSCHQHCCITTATSPGATCRDTTKAPCRLANRSLVHAQRQRTGSCGHMRRGSNWLPCKEPGLCTSARPPADCPDQLGGSHMQPSSLKGVWVLSLCMAPGHPGTCIASGGSDVVAAAAAEGRPGNQGSRKGWASIPFRHNKMKHQGKKSLAFCFLLAKQDC